MFGTAIVPNRAFKLKEWQKKHVLILNNIFYVLKIPIMFAFMYIVCYYSNDLLSMYCDEKFINFQAIQRLFYLTCQCILLKHL